MTQPPVQGCNENTWGRRCWHQAKMKKIGHMALLKIAQFKTFRLLSPYKNHFLCYEKEQN